ncbi:peptidase M19 [Shewanella sp. OPT22]|nr:peptidase M19 [Shewanella sp. OPT22]
MNSYRLSRRNFIKSTAAVAALPAFRTFAQPVISGKPLYMDGLCFLPDDLNDLKKSEIDAYICDISDIEAIKQPDGTTNYKRTYKACIKSIVAAQKRVLSHSNKLIAGLHGKDIQRAFIDHKTAVFFQIQGADCVEAKTLTQSWQQLNNLYDHGLRVLQLTHHYGNEFSGGALDNANNHSLNKPLTPNGIKLIHQLNHKNVLIDVSHSSPQSALDAARLSKSPIIQSHGACRAIVNNARCSPDEVIKAIADTGGTFGIFMMSFWLTNNKTPTPTDYINQIEHVVKVGGIDAATIANDYPLKGQKNLLKLHNNNKEGVKQYLGWWHSLRAKNVLGFDVEPEHVVIPEFNSIHRMERIDHELAKAGFSAPDRDKIMGKNLQRVLTEVLI